MPLKGSTRAKEALQIQPGWSLILCGLVHEGVNWGVGGGEMVGKWFGGREGIFGWGRVELGVSGLGGGGIGGVYP